ncbi:MAG: molybdopterin-binding protein [Kofleriaceae bacterium]
MGTVSVQLGILAVAKDPAHADLGDAKTVTERAIAAGHRVIAQQVVGDRESAIREVLLRWIADPTIDVIIVLGGADSDAVSTAMSPLVGHVLPGFTDLFRYLFFQEAGASAMLSAAEAARCTDTFVFVVPGAVAAAMEKLILPQFDPTTTPKNLVGQMPRVRAERDAPVVAATDEGSAGHGVPREVAPEKTQGGSGVSARLPAMPAPRRDPKRTGANVISRSPAPPDPPTKPIELARLEQEIAASQAKEDVTRRTDLQKLLPRVPPGADEIDDDDVNDDVTHADIIAAPPAKPFTIPAIAKPAPAPLAKITPVQKPVERPTPVPARTTPLPSMTKTAPAVKAVDGSTKLEIVDPPPVAATQTPAAAKHVEPLKRDSRPVVGAAETSPVGPVTIQPRKRDAEPKKPEPKPNGAPKRPPEVTDDALTKQRPIVEPEEVDEFDALLAKARANDANGPPAAKSSDASAEPAATAKPAVDEPATTAKPRSGSAIDERS